MSSDKKNGWVKWVLAIASIIFFAGIAYATIHFNSSNDKRIDARVDDVEDDVEELRKVVGKIDVIEYHSQKVVVSFDESIR